MKIKIKIINNNKAQVSTPVIMGLIFAIILVVVGISISSGLNTTATTLTSNSFSMGVFVNNTWNNQTVTPVDQGGVTAVYVGNTTQPVDSADYTVSGAGVSTVRMVNANASNVTGGYINYTYQAYGFVSGVTSTMILLIPLFFGLAGLALAAFFLNKSS